MKLNSTMLSIAARFLCDTLWLRKASVAHVPIASKQTSLTTQVAERIKKTVGKTNESRR
jgi:hypothetical protein